MKLLSVQQIRAWDQYTITQEPVSTLGLMERAGIRCYESILRWLKSRHTELAVKDFWVICGQGNNGGDGLVIARKLQEAGYRVGVFVLGIQEKGSGDFQINLERFSGTIFWIKTEEDIIRIPESGIWIDALFGNGLNKPLAGLAAQLVLAINEKQGLRLAVDLPSGLPGDVEEAMALQNADCIRADCTFTFQLPKTSLLFPESGSTAGEIQVIDIGLHPDYLKEVTGNWYYTENSDFVELPDPRFTHKGKKGHALIVAGSYGKLGAAILASRSALRAGCGLVTAHVPKVGYTVFQTALPEVMVETDDELYEIRNFPLTQSYQAVGVGPGLGRHPMTVKSFSHWLPQVKQPLVIDADGLNALAEIQQSNPGFKFPKGAILTPHPKEFERLFGKQENSLKRLQTAQNIAKQRKLVLVLKGANTAIVEPNGKVYFNSTGNSLLATAGSGDVLTGILTSLLAQGYGPVEAARNGVFLHGLLADRLKDRGIKRIIAGDLVNELKFI